MTKTDLDEKLVEALSNFSNEISEEYNVHSKEPATYADIATLADKTHALFFDFRQAILKYLD